MVVIFGSGATEVATFSVELAGFDGLNATTLGNIVSPAFSLKPWGSNGGKVVVTYSGLALAWGDVPGFTVQKKAATELALVPWGRGVGLSENLRRRLASELFAGTVQVMVEMKLFSDANDWGPTSSTYSGASLQSFQLMLRASSKA
ncbi:hypothetical protein BS78_03G382200 [Paspalum vaginatum]|nr:hypothetical protein BS78_03G382200 [Paspalum vaginatum]